MQIPYSTDKQDVGDTHPKNFHRCWAKTQTESKYQTKKYVYCTDSSERFYLIEQRFNLYLLIVVEAFHKKHKFEPQGGAGEKNQGFKDEIFDRISENSDLLGEIFLVWTKVVDRQANRQADHETDIPILRAIRNKHSLPLNKCGVSLCLRELLKHKKIMSAFVSDGLNTASKEFQSKNKILGKTRHMKHAVFFWHEDGQI